MRTKDPKVTGDKTFRLNAKKLFLTYPKNDTTKDSVVENLKKHFKKNLTGYSVGQETHLDGTLHLHVCVILQDKVDIRNPNTLDVIAGKHGNYQSLKNPKACIEYTMKEDKEVYLWGTCEEIVKKGGKFSQVAKELIDGKNPRDIMKMEPGFFLQHKRKVDEMYQFIEEDKKLISNFEPFGWQLDVLQKIEDQNERQILWVVDGDGNCGKSMLADWLECYGAFRCNAGKIQDITYLYQKEQLVVFDFERADQAKVQYGLLETFKNGKIISTKYQPIKKYQPCRVVVFANWEPNKNALSSDRWDIYTITPGIDFVQKEEFNFHQ